MLGPTTQPGLLLFSRSPRLLSLSACHTFEAVSSSEAALPEQVGQHGTPAVVLCRSMKQFCISGKLCSPDTLTSCAGCLYCSSLSPVLPYALDPSGAHQLISA